MNVVVVLRDTVIARDESVVVDTSSRVAHSTILMNPHHNIGDTQTAGWCAIGCCRREALRRAKGCHAA